MKLLISLSLAILLAGCATAAPNLINGKYYMGGDATCAKYKPISDSRIMCYDKNGKATGYRNAMSNQELQMYMFNQQQQATTYTNCYKTVGGGMNCSSSTY